MALLHALANITSDVETGLYAITVDHGLRASSADEAAMVAKTCRRLNVPHDTLVWSGWDGHGNLQGAARDARYRLMTDWAKSREISVIALGHTADDQAETVLMRLARESGVDGLSGIPPRRMIGGITYIRPLLDLTRLRLRSYLEARGLSWAEDPSNDDPRFERVRVRQAAAHLATLGLTSKALAEVAKNMSRAREALDWYTFVAARDYAVIEGGDVVISLRNYRVLPEEIARRMLVHAVTWIGGGRYPPRRKAVLDAIVSIRAGMTVTLNGCVLYTHRGTIRISREFHSVKDHDVQASRVWDGRWHVPQDIGPDAELRLRALGRQGLKQCGDWRQTGRPFRSLVSAPSLWRGDRVISAPLAGIRSEHDIELVGGGEEFFASILSH